MCGIAGLINLNQEKVSLKILSDMTDVLTHRGPDGRGLWAEGNVGIGHRRLSIIDLSTAGDQPMLSLDNRWVLTYNGEIYNYKELRRELESIGAIFRSQTDTEVVLNALVYWGVAALLRFNGMFALALWDKVERKLLIARDRYGIKPLYYAKQGNIFAFGSEQKAILINPEIRRSLNKETLLEYFTFQNIFTDRTLLKDIHLLPHGNFAYLDVDRCEWSQHQYWDYSFREPKYRKEKFEYLEELDRLFNQAVSRQLISDVELGSYLSGGIDSGSISALAAKKFPYLKTFTCGFDLSSASGIELAFDEREKAEAMSALFKTEHYEMILKAGDMERCLPKLAWHLEEPRIGQSYPNFYAAKLASKHVKVVLSGSGGDELFGGYPWRYYRAANCESFDQYVDQYYGYWQRMLNQEEIKQVFSPIWGDVGGIDTKKIFSNVFSSDDNELNRPEDFINYSLYFESKTFLHSLFVVEDKLSMAYGLESRVPFMDNDLVDFAMSCPVQLKLNKLNEVLKINENDPGIKQENYFQRTRDGKQLLRDMMSRYIPSKITGAEKQGFSSPDASWFKGESMDFVRNTLFKKDALIYNFLDQKSIKKLVEEHLAGQKNQRLLIWSLLNIEQYLLQVSL